MDPKANIAEQRELAQGIVDNFDAGEPIEDEAVRLAELVLALDGWRRGGGADPYLPKMETY